jgi:hypothetical protein
VRRTTRSLAHFALLGVLCAAPLGVSQTIRTDARSRVEVVVKNQGYLPFADGPIHYRSADVNDPIARLEKQLERGQAHLHFEPQHGYLRSVLDLLHVPVSSQGLVFAKTSFQFPLINPSNPRALYYNDDVYVGQVHSAKFLEFISFDPQQGPIFYVMDERQTDRPRFERAAIDCVQCHVSGSTRGVPGVMLRSVYAKPSGYPVSSAKSYVTGHESPLAERWGGWYVTAVHGAETGLGNLTVSHPENPEQFERPAVANIDSLSGHLSTAAYLAGSSDIVALMVLAHQTQMHNLITETNYKTRIALAAETAELPKQYEDSAERLVHYLLFANEVRLESPVAGNTSFAEEFAARGPSDSHGRSLRQFDLHTRIFKYACSYLIYSDSFDAIPQPAKQYIYRRLFEVLSGRDQSPEFKSLSSEDRRAILEILVETKPGVPPEWKQFVEQPSLKGTL